MYVSPFASCPPNILSPAFCVQPTRWGFEALLTNEFRTLNGTCASLVPQGSGYENVAIGNQVCTTLGSIPGQSFVDGNAFVRLSYGYSRSNLWRVRYSDVPCRRWLIHN